MVLVKTYRRNRPKDSFLVLLGCDAHGCAGVGALADGDAIVDVYQQRVIVKHPGSQAIVDCLDALLQLRGFTRRRRMWYRANDETFLIVHLQEAPFGGTFYINLGVSIRALAETSTPRVGVWHIFCRLDALVDEGTPSSRLSGLLDGETPEDVREMVDILLEERTRYEPLKLSLSREAIDHILARRSRIERLLDLDDKTSSAKERQAEITNALEGVGLPFS